MLIIEFSILPNRSHWKHQNEKKNKQKKKKNTKMQTQF